MSFIEIASKEGCMYTKWGPCFCNQMQATHLGEVCISCQNADELESIGKDWDEEYKKAEANNFNDS